MEPLAKRLFWLKDGTIPWVPGGQSGTEVLWVRPCAGVPGEVSCLLHSHLPIKRESFLSCTVPTWGARKLWLL